MAWIESHTNLIRHHKLLRMAKGLKIPPIQALGHLHCLWHNVLELREDGDITTWTMDEIAHYSGYEKGNNEFFYNILKDGWIDEINNHRLMHDWLDYAGRYLQTKYRSNPDKWKSIQSKYSQTAQSDSTDTIPTLPTVPNLSNHSKQPSATKVALDKIYQDGLNIYSLINKLKKESRVGAEVPDEVLLRVCESYWKAKPKIKEEWAWFQRVLIAEWEQYNAQDNIKQSEKFKTKGMAQSIKDILGKNDQNE